MSKQTAAATRLCSIEDCGRAVHSRGWCSLHYQRWHRNGDPLVLIDRTKPIVHGTHDGYKNHRCRCEKCKRAWADYINARNWRKGKHRPQAVASAERRHAAEARDNHGSESRYRLGCRCRICKDGAAAARRRRRARVSVAA